MGLSRRNGSVAPLDMKPRLIAPELFRDPRVLGGRANQPIDGCLSESIRARMAEVADSRVERRQVPVQFSRSMRQRQRVGLFLRRKGSSLEFSKFCDPVPFLLRKHEELERLGRKGRLSRAVSQVLNTVRQETKLRLARVQCLSPVGFEPGIDQGDHGFQPSRIDVDQEEIVHVAEIRVGMKGPEDPIVQGVQVHIRSELAGQIADGQTLVGRTAEPTLLRRNEPGKLGISFPADAYPGVVGI